jgi:hypothetical protein
MDKMDATIIENINSNFRLNAEPFTCTCRTYCVWWRIRKYRILKRYVEDLVTYWTAVGDVSLPLLDLRDGFFH